MSQEQRPAMGRALPETAQFQHESHSLTQHNSLDANAANVPCHSEPQRFLGGKGTFVPFVLLGILGPVSVIDTSLSQPG